ncbi:MAG: PhzF family phenazine biosynthesis protein [Ahrensia sp.]|nr:PhzF family phenazine biosynthesis protein [Ahrensia sp.]
MNRRFAIMDVFTDTPLSGNQLGVIYDCDGLDTASMQAIARELNFSETVFLAPARHEAHSAAMRIFTPANELPFAGHPTVGGAIAVAVERGIDSVGQGIVVLEEEVGAVRCAVRFGDDAVGKAVKEAAYAEFDLPVAAVPWDGPDETETIAAALSLDPHELSFENHTVSNFDGGLTYTLVPVRDLGVLAKAKPVLNIWNAAFGNHSHNSAFVYCRETVGHDNHFHARMFAPDAGIPEDPATGSAVASLAGAIVAFDAPPDGLHVVRIEQGFEMGRPSLITLEIDVENGVQSGGRIGGHAVFFARGHIDI